MYKVMTLEEWEDHFSQSSLKKANQATADRMIEQRGRNRREKMEKMVEDEVRNALKKVGVTISKAQDAWIGHRNRVVEAEERRAMPIVGDEARNALEMLERAVVKYMVYRFQDLDELANRVNALIENDPRWQPRGGIVVYWDGTRGHLAYLQTMVKME